jgi:hypothetical protein
MGDYAEEKSLAEARDRELGLDTAATEAEIAARLAREDPRRERQTWNHLSPQVFQTPYAELARIVREADPDRRARVWADLGAAYGRLGIVLAEIRPDARFVGMELVPERVREGRRIYLALGLDPESLVAADLRECALPEADLYFIYDFGTRAEIERVLEALRLPARRGPVTVVGRGRGVRDAIERGHPWLADVIPPVHGPHSSIYRSAAKESESR